MLMRTVKIFLLVVLGSLVGRGSQATSPPGIPWCQEFQAIQDAAGLRDPIARGAALRGAIRKGLLENPPEAAGYVLGYLGEQSRWLDLRPFEDLIAEFGRVNNPTSRDMGAYLDSIELPRMSRDERLRIYSTAIVEGKTTLRHGYPLVRMVAMGDAALDGLDELRPLIEAHYVDLSAEDQQIEPLPKLLLLLELRAGATDREDALRLASQRLAAMKDGEFRDRMNADLAFRNVVEAISKGACSGNPFDRGRLNPGCASIKDVVKRQLQLEKATPKPNQAETGAPTMRDWEASQDTWLGHMKEVSQVEPVSQKGP